jgi:hypothetical protein
MRLRIVLAAAILAGAALLPGTASAQEGGIFSLLGLTPKQQDDIEYRERAPLVVPPNSALPQPVEYTAADQANWPRDPDVRRRLRDEYLRKNPPKELTESQKRLQFIQLTKKKPKKKNVGGVQPEFVDPVLASGEPRRRYLTDPPEGARAPAAAPVGGVVNQ